MRELVRREKIKVDRELGPFGETGADALSILEVEEQDDGVIAARVSHRERELPKPIYFVLEDGAYKVSVPSPVAGTPLPAGARNYLVRNKDSVTRFITCTGNGGMNIPAYQNATMSCSNTCSFWAKGSTFTVGNASATCDYHMWGWDVDIINNQPFCRDNC